MFDVETISQMWKRVKIEPSGIMLPFAVNYVTKESNAHKDKETHQSSKYYRYFISCICQK